MNANMMQMLMQMLSMGSNPQQMMQNMIARNPQANAILNQMRNSGMTPEQYVRQYAKQNNIDIEPMLNKFRQRGFK